MLVTLYGGNDGLNTVIPYQDPTYASGRGALAIEDSKVLPLDEGFGLHPALTGFKKLWDQGKLGIVQGVGFADPNYSHFESMDIWQSGSTDASVESGWIGRWLDAEGSSPLRAVGVGPTTPVLLQGQKVQGSSLPVGGLKLPGSSPRKGPLLGTGRHDARRSPAARRLGEIQRRPPRRGPSARPHPGPHGDGQPAPPERQFGQRHRCPGGAGHRQRGRWPGQLQRPGHSAVHGGQSHSGRFTYPGLQRGTRRLRHPCRPDRHPTDPLG